MYENYTATTLEIGGIVQEILTTKVNDTTATTPEI